MEIRFVRPDLRELDALTTCEALAIPLVEDQRPLRGPCGLVDWRLGGELSRLVQAGKVSGRTGETLLLASDGRFSVDKVFVFGAGQPSSADRQNCAVQIQNIMSVLSDAKVRTAALAIPGRTRGLSASDAIESFLLVERNLDIVYLIEDLEAQKDMAAVLLRERRKAQALAQIE